MGKQISAIPKAVMVRILMDCGAKRVSDGAALAFAEVISSRAMLISQKANELSKHAGRKTIHEEDVFLAVK